MYSEWAVNIQRDSYASYVGHYPVLANFAIAENESIGRERYNFMQVDTLPYLFVIICLFTDELPFLVLLLPPPIPILFVSVRYGWYLFLLLLLLLLK